LGEPRSAKTSGGDAVKVISVDTLDILIKKLRRGGYRVVAPKVADGAVVYDCVNGVEDLPLGFIDKQGPGSYRLNKDDKAGYFDILPGSRTWKHDLFPPKQKLFTATRDGKSFSVEREDQTSRLAFLGVRACELRAIQIQDKIFFSKGGGSLSYAKRRKSAFIIVVNCRRAGATCFCDSMKTGPRATEGYDLALTELTNNFLVETGSDRGQRMLDKLDARSARPAEKKAATVAIGKAVRDMKRSMPRDIRKILLENLESPHWETIAGRCLNCSNCTLVCPTCFCSTVTDKTSLDGEIAERWQEWDTCFSLDFSYIHGGSVRRSGGSRFRQWLTHKLTYWHDQFDSSGCVGCGRCITWCPVGIDITEEAKAFKKRRT
jgi:ferredoxin